MYLRPSLHLGCSGALSTPMARFITTSFREAGGESDLGGAQEKQSWCSKGLVAGLSSAAAKAVLVHLGWEGVAWLSKKVWYLELPKPPSQFGKETLTTVPTLPYAALAFRWVWEPTGNQSTPRSLTTTCPTTTALHTASLVMSAMA